MKTTIYYQTKKCDFAFSALYGGILSQLDGSKPVYEVHVSGDTYDYYCQGMLFGKAKKISKSGLIQLEKHINNGVLSESIEDAMIDENFYDDSVSFGPTGERLYMRQPVAVLIDG